MEIGVLKVEGLTKSYASCIMRETREGRPSGAALYCSDQSSQINECHSEHAPAYTRLRCIYIIRTSHAQAIESWRNGWKWER